MLKLGIKDMFLLVSIVNVLHSLRCDKFKLKEIFDRVVG